MYGSLLHVLLLTAGANAQGYVGEGYPSDPGIGYAETTDYGHLGCWKTFWGPEPQTCYAPRFGCYPGNNRFMHRYPAFHGYHYRRPYNYRNVFDYPWHAELHEPTSHFSYNVLDESPAAPLAPPLPAEEIQSPAAEEAPTASRGTPRRQTVTQLSREEILRRREIRQAAKPQQLRTGRPAASANGKLSAVPSELKIRSVQHVAPLPKPTPTAATRARK